MPRSAPAGSGGLASTLTMALRGCISCPYPRRLALRSSALRGARPTPRWVSSSSPPPTPRQPRSAAPRLSRVSICDLLADLNVASGVSAGGKGSAVTDGLPLPVQLKNGRGELLATLSADVEGLGALRALAADGGVLGLGHGLAQRPRGTEAPPGSEEERGGEQGRNPCGESWPREVNAWTCQTWFERVRGGVKCHDTRRARMTCS